MKALLTETAERAARYLEGIADRRVAPLPEDVARLEALGGPLPELPSDPAEVLALLDDIGSPATVATAGRPLFWIRHRWFPACGAGGQLDGGRVGPKRMHADHVSGGGEAGRDCPGMDGRPAGFAVGIRSGICYRHNDGKLLRPGCSADGTVAACGMECRGGRIVWGAADSRGGGR